MVTPKKHFAFGSASQQSPLGGSPGEVVSLEPSLAVIFKALQKRDPTTRAKASEDLLKYVKTSDNLESDAAQESIISSWIALYPSLATDIDKNVRINAHMVLGHLVVRFKKKTARSLPQTAASWLIGLHDNDRAVARAAQDSFASSFPSESKRSEFKKVFRASIIDRIYALILDGSAASLSDSRFVNLGDADAKYSNVISASFQVLVEIVSMNEDSTKVSRDVLDNPQFWKHVESTDAPIQRASLSFLTASLRISGLDPYIELLRKSLPSLLAHVHPSNILDMVRTLCLIATIEPDLLFVSRIGSKKSIPNRLTKFISNATGPGTSIGYWNSMYETLEQATKCSDHTDQVLQPLLDGFETSMQKAPKLQQECATEAFSNLCICYLDAGSQAARTKLHQILTQDIRQIGPLQAYTAAISKLVLSDVPLAITLLDQINQQARRLLTSQDSEDSVILHDWLELNKNLLSAQELQKTTLHALRSIIEESFDMIESENIAYRFVCHALKSLPIDDLCQDARFQDHMSQFLSNLPIEAFAQGRETCALLADLFRPKEKVEQRNKVLQSVLTSPLAHQTIGIDFLGQLLDTQIDPEPALIENWIQVDLEQGNFIDEKRWAIYFPHILRWPQESRTGLVFMRVVDNIMHLSSARSDDLLLLIRDLTRRDKALDCLDDTQMQTLSRSIWSIYKICRVSTVSETLAACTEHETLSRFFYAGILEQVLDAGSNSVPIQLLCELSQSISDKAKFDICFQDKFKVLLEDVMPQQVPNQFAILHPIGILANLTTGSAISNAERTAQGYDNEGLSTYLRLCIFLGRGFGTQNEAIYFYQLLASELVAAKMQHPQANSIFDSDVHTAAEFERFQLFVDTTTTVVDRLTPFITFENDSKLDMILSLFGTADCSPVEAFYRALGFHRVLSKSRENGLGVESADLIYTRTLDDIHLSVACSAALSELLLTTKKATFQRNKLSSDLSGNIAEGRLPQTLVRLNALLPTEVTEITILPRPRLMLLVKNLLNYAEPQQRSKFVNFEIVTLLSRLLPEVKTEFGSFWDSTIKWLIRVLENENQEEGEADLPLQYSILKAFSWLASEFESNDDLSEFWLNAQPHTQRVIAGCFVSNARHTSNDQAMNLCTLIASRLMRTISIKILEPKHKVELMGLISSGIEQVQLTAYSALQQLVDEAREDMIMSTALAKEYEEVEAELPAELLSIVLDCPIEDEAELYDSPELLPTAQRGYCMAWALLFRYFQNTPLRMRVKLINDLQAIELTEGLLGFIFSVLRLRDDKPADISKISKISLDSGYTDGRSELLAHATHLYHLCLLHIPALVRSWWIDCKDRTLSTAVEQLTEKNYSTLLIQSDVQSLQSEQSKSLLKDDNLSIRVSNGGRDIFTTYEIDEQKMEMAIRIPANYPLRRVVVEGLQRIGVKDNQWRAWLLASQAVLTAQNGSILDAISLFQRNVSLHFEGVADCNICFSILSVQDKSLPSKKCQTCKNLFHSSCLFKWFKSSSQSRCPLCRTSFAF